MINFPLLSETMARHLISTGGAGYWELSLRDSLGKRPIAHDKQTCIFLEGNWHLVPLAAFELKSLGRVGDQGMSAALHSVEVHDPDLICAIQSEAAKTGKRLA